MDKTFDNSDVTGSPASQPALDPERRKILLIAASAAGVAALATASIPFIASMNPSERERAAGAPAEADLSLLKPGAKMTVEWRGKPVWILRRTDAMLKTLQDPRHLVKLVDPDSQVKDQQPPYARNAFRSVKPEYLVVVGICTHLGCVPTFRPNAADANIDPEWDGGYYCPCHGSKFDLAGRVYRNVPAPTNLVIPPYHFLTDSRLMIGESPKGVTQ